MTKIEQLTAALAASTQGEWNNTEQSNGLNSVYGNCQFDSMADADLVAFDIRNGDDADFIMLAHNIMPDLLDVARWADATLEWARVCFPEYADVEVCNELEAALEKLK